MRIVAGADGCRAGWVLVIQDLDTSRISWRLCADATALIAAVPAPGFLAIDIPIGLPESGSRAADRLARRVLGGRRGSSVFPAPLRPMLVATNYREACDIRAAREGKRMSIQAWGILAKIRDVDHVLAADPGLQERIHEVHPEVCFRFMGEQRSPQFSKKTAAGRGERLALLEPLFGPAPVAALAEKSLLAGQPDDILDAFAALWTARRIASGTARCLPAHPELDSAGLRMEIVY